MKKRKDRIYIKQWLDLKPYDNQTSTDSYYLKLCNKVLQSIIANRQSFVLKKFLDNDGIKMLACFLTSYFEDRISETNIWNTFTRVYLKLYGKHLPFYETSEYNEQEIKLAEICFLIWYFLNTIQQDNFIPPLNDFIKEISDEVLDIFADVWEYAPANNLLKSFYSIDENETDYYTARNLIDNVLFKTYLFYPDSLMDLRDSELKILEENENHEYLLNFLNENRDYKLHNTYTRLLGLKGQEWVAEILGDHHKLSKRFLKISPKINGYFFYKGQNRENVLLEHIASGKKFELTKKSFDLYDDLKEIDTIIFMGIVEWRNEWWFSGVSFQTSFHPDLVRDEKNSLKSRRAVDFLDHKNKDIYGILDEQFRAFKKFNSNQQIAFLFSEEIETFINDYIAFYNNSLKFSKEEKDKARQSARAGGFFGNEQVKQDFSEESEHGLVFFNPKGGTEIALAINSAFPVRENPFYNASESEEHIMRLLFAEDLSTELTMYCIDNFKNDLEFFKSAEGKMYLDNIDFLLRFWKRGNYFTKPAITFTGKRNSGI